VAVVERRAEGAASAPVAEVARRTTLRRLVLASLVPAGWVVGLTPLAKLATDGVTGALGANPIAEGLNRLGFWTLTFLVATLVPTPAHDYLGLNFPVRLRRTLGLLAFSYGALHFAWYLGVDKFFDFAEVLGDVTKRKFIAIGFAALLLMVPLAVTSTDAAVRRLGYRRWKRLHRLVYLSALLGVVHFLWRVKADHRRPALFALALGVLLLLRLPTAVRALRR
jgi:methionine sulfoxide reductase heme-binding subunit